MGKGPASSAPTVNERSGAKAASGPPAEQPSGDADVVAIADVGRYLLGEEIARGGMGRVVEATDRVLGRHVALKEVLSDDAEARRRFAREIRITARLEHPSIVPVHDAGTMPDGTPFYVMRKVSGQPLEDLVGAASTVEQRLALLPHVVAAAQALAHAHARGVLHRDLKPSNILVGSLGETVVIDWGLAKVIDEPDDDEPGTAAHMASAGDSLRTRIGTVFGTPGFMSPEQLRGDPVDARGDVYALGATLYYVLSRRPPHAASSGDDMMKAALVGPPVPLGQLVKGVPRALLAIVDKALAYDELVRYRDAGALVEELQRFLTGQLVAAHHYSRRERIARFLRRHRLPVAVAAIATVALMIGGWVAISQVISERNRADAALRDALDRNDDLVVNAAQMLLTSNPTAAVAMVKPLAHTRWREARAIGMAASAAGVPWGYESSARTGKAAMLEDGVRLLTLGTDGVVRMLDLAAHTSRTLFTVAPQSGMALVDHDRTLVTWLDASIVIIDLLTGERRSLTAPDRIRELAGIGTTIWFATANQHTYVQRFDEPVPRELAFGGDVHTIRPAPDGSWIAFAGPGLWLAHGDAPPRKIVDGRAATLDWSSASDRVVSIVGNDAVEITLKPEPTITAQFHPRLPVVMASFEDRIWVGGLGVLESFRAGMPTSTVFTLQLQNMVLQMCHAYHGTLIAFSGGSKVEVIGRTQTLLLQAPASDLFGLIGRDDSKYLVALTGGAVLAWDLSTAVAVDLQLGELQSFAPVGTGQLILSEPGEPSRWIDLADGSSVEHPFGWQPSVITPAPGGDLVLNTDLTHHGRLWWRRANRVVELPDTLSVAMFADPNLLAISDTTGTTSFLELPSLTRHTRYVATSGAEELMMRRSWVAVRHGDGLLWRLDQRLGIGTTLKLAASPPSATLGEDGAVYFADGAQLRVWQADGTISLHVQLPRAIERIIPVDDSHLVVFTDDRAGYLVEEQPGRGVVSRFPPGTRVHRLALSETTSFTISSIGELTATDLASGISWVFAKARAGTFLTLTITEGARQLFASAGDRLAIWPLEKVEGPEATATFLDRLTNARAPTGAAALAWR